MGSVLLQRGSLSSASDEKPLGRGLPIRTRRRRSKLPRESSESGREAQVAATYEDALQAMGGEVRDGRGVGRNRARVLAERLHHGAQAQLLRILSRGLHDSSPSERCLVTLHIECQAVRPVSFSAAEAIRARSARYDAHVLRRGGPRTQSIRAFVPPDSADPHGPWIAEGQVMANINRFGFR